MKSKKQESVTLDAPAEKIKEFENSSDFANYFCTYGFLYHQKQMLTDKVRMQSYYKSIFNNESCFADKVVLDVGTGSGILAIWAAQAGASKVYAVEATGVANQARKLVAANNLEDKIVVIQAKMEEVILPEKVDIIISEWMGYFLLRESMLDSVIYARDKWLKQGGAMYPSHATMFLAPITYEEEVSNKYKDYLSAMDGWVEFLEDTKASFGVDMSCLTGSFQKEQEEYYLQTSQWAALSPSNLIGEGVIIKDIDILTCNLDSIKSVNSELKMKINNATRFCGFVGWFDVVFRGSPQNPTSSVITLSTSPYIGYTHWGQQCFLLHPPTRVKKDDVIEGNIKIVRRKDNQRLLNIQITHTVIWSKDGAPRRAQTNTYQMD